MIVAYILVAHQFTSWPVADADSCERMRAVRGGDSRCVQVLIPAPSREAYLNMPKGETK